MTQTASAAAQPMLSEKILVEIQTLVDFLDQLDEDPMIRPSIARIAVRDFAGAIAARFSADADAVTGQFEDACRALRMGGVPQPGPALARIDGKGARTGAEKGTGTDAGDQEPGGEPFAGSVGGGVKADPQGRGPDGGARKGARDHGSEWLGKVDPVLRVGGA